MQNDKSHLNPTPNPSRPEGVYLICLLAVVGCGFLVLYSIVNAFYFYGSRSALTIIGLLLSLWVLTYATYQCFKGFQNGRIILRNITYGIILTGIGFIIYFVFLGIFAEPQRGSGPPIPVALFGSIAGGLIILAGIILMLIVNSKSVKAFCTK